MATLGQKVKQLRSGHTWTLSELASRTGLSTSYISVIEKDQRPSPSFQSILRLASAFNVPVAYFADPEELPACEGDLLSRLQHLYDHDTQRFIASESSRPYVAFAKQLAEDEALSDTAQVLQLLAQFLREHKPPYGLS